MRGLILMALLASAPVKADAVGDLHGLFAKERQVHYRFHPMDASYDGVAGYNDKLGEATVASVTAERAALRGLLADLARIDRAQLPAEDQLNYDLFAYEISDEEQGLALDFDRNIMDADSGFFAYMPDMARGLSMTSVKDYEDYLARLKAVPRYFGQRIDAARRGLKTGLTAPQVVLGPVLASAKADTPVKAEASGYYAPFLNMPATVPSADRDRLAAEAKAVIEGPIRDAYGAVVRFLEKDYIPKAKKSLGAKDWPDGVKTYAWLAKHHTTLDLTPDQIHEIGLKEVARIHAEMLTEMKAAGWTGDFAGFLHYLRTDPQFYARTPDELLRYAAFLAKKIDIQLPKLFGKLPRQPYGVEPVPASIAPNYTTGRYVGAPLGGTKGGAYWVNTYDLAARPLYEMPALTLHEAVPGHHLQGALSKELENVPAFRLNMYPTAYGEGWGLYSERLGLELDMYKTPYERFGRLSYEMWRALRLVVDTGIHMKGWSREQAVNYMAENSALSMRNINAEVDRYIAWPGQALGYKMGEITIRRLRSDAEAELGARFDLRGFHDTVLSAGGIPLPILEKRVHEWVAARKAAK